MRISPWFLCSSVSELFQSKSSSDHNDVDFRHTTSDTTCKMAEGSNGYSSLKTALLINFHYLTLFSFLPLAFNWIICKGSEINSSATVLIPNHEMHTCTYMNLNLKKYFLTEKHFTSYFNNTWCCFVKLYVIWELFYLKIEYFCTKIIFMKQNYMV